eukprot:51553-Eustigmatos_ZCMA.PRE.1
MPALRKSQMRRQIRMRPRLRVRPWRRGRMPSVGPACRGPPRVPIARAAQHCPRHPRRLHM